MRRILFLHLLLIFTIGCSKAQKPEIVRFEKRVQEIYAKVYPATVKVVILDENGRENGGGAGVVVSRDGLILTAGHQSTPGGRFRIEFPDGRKVAARALGKITKLDVAMLQIEDKGSYPFAEIGRSAGLRHGEPCMSLGHAVNLISNDPALKLGFVVSGEKPKADMVTIQTTCLMEPGDSGGPTFDMDGRVIGIRSFVDAAALNNNFDIPVDVHLKYWDYLSAGKSSEEVPQDGEQPISDLPAAEHGPGYMAYSDTTAVLLKFAATLPHESYRLESTLRDTAARIVCTPLNMGGYLPGKELSKKTYLLSKSSMVGEMPKVMLPGGKTVDAKIVSRDEACDLVLLEIPVGLKKGLADLSKGVEGLSRSQVGTFLFSSLPDKACRVSVASGVPYTIRNTSRGIFLGIMSVWLEEENTCLKTD